MRTTSRSCARKSAAAGSATYVLGYRTAMLVSGSLALIMADHLVWRVVYVIMAALMLVGAITVFFAEEPQVADRAPRTLIQSVYLPFWELVKRYRWQALTILAFCATFKFGEQFAQVLSQPFYRDMGFTKSEIGSLSKAVGFAAFAVGGGVGGTLVARYGLRRMLVVFGIFQSLVHVGYLVISLAGHNLGIYGATLFVENFSFAMATARGDGCADVVLFAIGRGDADGAAVESDRCRTEPVRSVGRRCRQREVAARTAARQRHGLSRRAPTFATRVRYQLHAVLLGHDVDGSSRHPARVFRDESVYRAPRIRFRVVSRVSRVIRSITSRMPSSQRNSRR